MKSIILKAMNEAAGLWPDTVRNGNYIKTERLEFLAKRLMAGIDNLVQGDVKTLHFLCKQAIGDAVVQAYSVNATYSHPVPNTDSLIEKLYSNLMNGLEKFQVGEVITEGIPNPVEVITGKNPLSTSVSSADSENTSAETSVTEPTEPETTASEEVKITDPDSEADQAPTEPAPTEPTEDTAPIEPILQMQTDFHKTIEKPITNKGKRGPKKK